MAHPPGSATIAKSGSGAGVVTGNPALTPSSSRKVVTDGETAIPRPNDAPRASEHRQFAQGLSSALARRMSNPAHGGKRLSHSESSSVFETTDGRSRADSDESAAEHIKDRHEFELPEDRDLTAVDFTTRRTSEILDRRIVRVKEVAGPFLKTIDEYNKAKQTKRGSQDLVEILTMQSDQMAAAIQKLRFNLNAPRIGKEYLEQNKPIPFFLFQDAETTSIPTENARNISRYLNDKIVLNAKKPFGDIKATYLINPELTKELQKTHAKTTKDFRFMQLMLMYNEALRYLCAKLRGDIVVMKLCERFVNIKHIDKLIEHIKRELPSPDTPKKDKEISLSEFVKESHKKTPTRATAPELVYTSETNPYLQRVGEEISVFYYESAFQLLLEQVGKVYLRSLETDDKKYSYKYIVDGFDTKFSTASCDFPAIEFNRAIKGGYLTWKGRQGGRYGVTLLDGFNSQVDPIKEEQEVAKYVGRCYQIVGEQLFHDPHIVMNFSMGAFIFGNTKSPGPAQETALEGQERVFKFLETLKTNPALALEFRNTLQEQLEAKSKVQNVAEVYENKKGLRYLKDKHLDCMAIIDYMMKFYRAPFQAFINTPTQTLKFVLAAIFRNFDEIPIIPRIKDWEEDETKKIQIEFEVDSVKFQFLRKGAVGTAEDPICILQQRLSIDVERPGRKELKDPVSLSFHYEILKEDIPPAQKAELDLQLERIAFALKLLGFPPLKKIEKKEVEKKGESPRKTPRLTVTPQTTEVKEKREKPSSSSDKKD